MFKSMVLIGLIFVSLNACNTQLQTSPNAIPTASATAENNQDPQTAKEIASIPSPDGSKVALWKGVNEFIFNDYSQVSITIQDSRNNKELQVYPIAFPIQRDYEMHNDILWWQDEAHFFLTTQDSENRVQIYRYTVGAPEAELFYTLPAGAQKLIARNNSVYFLNQERFQALDTSDLTLSTLAEFKQSPSSLEATEDPTRWILGVKQGSDFQIKRTPPAPLDYYQVDLKSQTLSPCQHGLPATTATETQSLPTCETAKAAL